MYKDKLIDVITEKFLNDEISDKRFVALTEKVSLVSEDTAKKAYDNMVSKELLTEITSRTWDEVAWGWGGAKIKVAFNKKYKQCKLACMEGDPDRKNYCVEKCRHEYYEALEKNRMASKEKK